MLVCRSPTTPNSPKRDRFGLFPVRSPLLRESRLFSFPVTTKMFQFITYASLLMHVILSLQLSGLSHSEIPGSKVICTLPGLIAAYHVLHRLREPRHPPVALLLLFFCLNYTSSFCSTLLVIRVKLSTIFFKLCRNLLRVQIVNERASFDAKVENNGFEPLTPCLQSRCSSQLS